MRAAFARYARDGRFHQLDLSAGGLRLAHERPYIFLLPRLFSPLECERLRSKAAGAMAPQSFDDAVPRERSSEGATLRNEEVPTLRARLASLARVSLSQLQPLKVSRYRCGERFEIHTDNIRGDLRGQPVEEDDWWADRARIAHGVVGAPISGVSRIVTIFVYLNDVRSGGRTRWRWTDYDAALGGVHGRHFYDSPSPGSGRTDVVGGSGEYSFSTCNANTKRYFSLSLLFKVLTSPLSLAKVWASSTSQRWCPRYTK